jgi:glycosyltransferase involved in cell wall biosynthesis
MRIALLGHTSALGGTTDILVQGRDYFRGRGHDVRTIFGTGSNPVDPRVKDAIFFNSSGTTWRQRIGDYARLIEETKPDVVYAIAGLQEMDVFRFLRCPRVRLFATLEQHGFVDIPFWLSHYSDFMEACTANTPDAVEEVKRYSHKPTFLLPYLIPELDASGDLAKIPAQADPAKRIEVAVVSRLEMLQKRLHWLPRIVRRCRDLGLPLQWHIYGEGPEGPRLRKELADADDITFHGWTNRATLYQRLPGHDIFFLCSRWEGLPVSMLEAMRCGLACVVPDIPTGIHWTLSHGGGWLYQAISPQAAANALAQAVADRNLLLQKRREALRLSFELFSTAQAAEGYRKLEAAFEKLMFNGNALDIATAPPLRLITLSGYLRRASYAFEKTANSPAWLLNKLTGRR